MRRRTIRYVAAGLAAAMAVIYFLIGLGVLQVVEGQASDSSMFGFGASAGAAFLLGAILLAELDRRWLWIAGALLQVMVVWGYFAIAPQRDPAFELWGLTLRVIQIPLLLALIWLALRPADAHPDALVHLRH